jgi:hypothetical protein
MQNSTKLNGISYLISVGSYPNNRNCIIFSALTGRNARFPHIESLCQAQLSRHGTQLKLSHTPHRVCLNRQGLGAHFPVGCCILRCSVGIAPSDVQSNNGGRNGASPITLITASVRRMSSTKGVQSYAVQESWFRRYAQAYLPGRSRTSLGRQ